MPAQAEPQPRDGTRLWLSLALASTWAMVGLAWVVLWVQYPGYLLLDGPAWQGFHQQHCERIAWIVLPGMALELASAIALVAHRRHMGAPATVWAGLALTLVCWLLTAVRGVPLHQTLAQGWDAAVIRELILWHGLRTACWTAKGLLLLDLWRRRVLLTKMLPPPAGRPDQPGQ